MVSMKKIAFAFLAVSTASVEAGCCRKNPGPPSKKVCYFTVGMGSGGEVVGTPQKIDKSAFDKKALTGVYYGSFSIIDATKDVCPPSLGKAREVLQRPEFCYFRVGVGARGKLVGTPKKWEFDAHRMDGTYYGTFQIKDPKKDVCPPSLKRAEEVRGH